MLQVHGVKLSLSLELHDIEAIYMLLVGLLDQRFCKPGPVLPRRLADPIRVVGNLSVYDHSFCLYAVYEGIAREDLEKRSHTKDSWRTPLMPKRVSTGSDPTARI
ncbi:hypothetical protein GW17_00010978 [Ensete ventricosum]|nr:hypothetical protein GW17_00010978 [Ensete ventricosum]